MGTENQTLEERAEEALENGERVTLPVAIGMLHLVRSKLFTGTGDSEKALFTFSKEADESLKKAAIAIIESKGRMSHCAGQLYKHYGPGSKAWDVAGILEGGSPEDNISVG